MPNSEFLIGILFTVEEQKALSWYLRLSYAYRLKILKGFG